MIVTLSPAKSMDFDKTIPSDIRTVPTFIKDTEKLVKNLKKMSAKELASFMEISDSLAKLNYERYQRWKTPFTKDNARPCVFTFDGPVYKGFDWLAYKKADYERLQKTVRIVSGLHGLLKPFDMIQAYRLDMHTPLENHDGNNLYDLWRDKVTDMLNKECKDILVNCASKEYSEAIDFDKLKCKVVTIEFKNLRKGKYMVIGLIAKKARGMFADFVVRENVKKFSDLKNFNRDGYAFDDKESTDDNLIFLRKQK